MAPKPAQRVLLGLGLLAAVAIGVAFLQVPSEFRSGWPAATVGTVVAMLLLLHCASLLFWKRPNVPASLALAILGSWCFLGVSLAGLAAASVVGRSSESSGSSSGFFAANALTVRVLITAALVALYVVGIILVRHRWILLPNGLLARELMPPESLPCSTTISLPIGSNGFFVQENQAARASWLEEVHKSEEPPALLVQATRAYVEAEGVESLKDVRADLGKLLDQRDPLSDRDMANLQRLSHIVVLTRSDGVVNKANYVMKVQNQLLVFALMLLAAVASFGILGWGAPMIMGAIAAIIVRVRYLTPLGNKENYDGGARWMVLFLTPLMGAVASVLGLVVISALVALRVFSDPLNSSLSLPELALSPEALYFSPVALALAAAFGWSARLLDRMLTKLTNIVDAKSNPTTSTDD